MFSKRTDWLQETNQITKLLERLRAQNVPYCDLTESNPTRCHFNYLESDLLTPFENPANLKYSPDPRGMLATRKIIADYYLQAHGAQIHPDQIFLTAGTSEAYSYLFKLLLNSGESILTPSPSYPLLDFLCDLNDIQQFRYTLDPNSNWSLDLASLKTGISSKRPKTMIVINPNNPTGSFLSEKELLFMNDQAKLNQFSIISDEVFIDYNLNAKLSAAQSLIANESVLTFTLSGISKVLGLPQMKLSWIVVSGPKDLVAEACGRLEIIADTFLSVSTPVQNSLKHWMGKRSEIQSEILTRIRGNSETLKELIRKQPSFELHSNQAGWCAVLRNHNIDDDLDFTLKLLEFERVLIQPGFFYDFPCEGYFVISLLPQPSDFLTGVSRIIEYSNRMFKKAKI